MTRARGTLIAAALASALAVALAGCDGKSGTYQVSLVTAAGSHVLDGVVRTRMALSDPHTIVEADRNPDGSFALDLEVPASGGNGNLTFEGLDSAGTVIAWGRTPPLPIAAINAPLRIYVAAPRSFAASPLALDPPRADVAVATLSYGVLLAGGTDAAGATRADLLVYDAYDHQPQPGLDLPAPRADLIAVIGATGYAYLFGGRDAAGQATATLWRFDTTVAPSGSYLDLSAMSGAALARAGADVVPIGGEQFLVTGAPPALIDGVGLRAAALTSPASIGGHAVATSNLGGIVDVFVGDGAGATGVALFSVTGYTEVAGAPADAIRTGHGVARLGDGTVIAIGGAVAGTLSDSAIHVDPATGTATSTAGALSTPRKDAAIAATTTYLIVAGGTDAAGTVLGDAEILDTATLHDLATVALVVPRTGARAATLPNGQIMIVGGRDASGAPIATIELFTPPAPSEL